MSARCCWDVVAAFTSFNCFNLCLAFAMVMVMMTSSFFKINFQDFKEDEEEW